jgi:ornithine--oxo-acid transaminase
MSLDLEGALRGRDVYAEHAAHVNPQFVKVLKTIGFDRGFVKGRGQYLWDADGRRYLDMLAGYAVHSIGRNHPAIRAAILEAMDLDLPNLVQMDAPRLSWLLAERLKALAPDGLEKVFFTNSGTEAVEGAMKLARATTGKPGVLHFERAFHGLSTGSLSLNGCHSFREGFGPLLPGSRAIPFGDLGALEAELKKGDVAALVAEPIQGKGVYVPDDGFFPAAQALLRKHKALLVLDEVQTGFGRTGKMFALEHWGLRPDVLTVAKALSGGVVPVGAILFSDRVYKKTFSRMDRCVVHSSTFGQNDVAMAAGLAALDVIEGEALTERAAARGELLLSRLRELQAKHPVIRDVRGRGLMIGIEFGAPSGFLAKARWKLVGAVEKGLFTQVIVMHLMEHHGVLTQVAGHQVDIMKLIPPLTISEEDVHAFVDALDATLAEAAVSGAMLQMSLSLGKQALQRQ